MNHTYMHHVSKRNHPLTVKRVWPVLGRESVAPVLTVLLLSMSGLTRVGLR